jgi:MFS family permease
MKKSSTWTALQNPVFRKLWFASLISGTCVAAHDTAATWTMNMLTNSPLLLSLMSTVASLPFFLFTLPAGALADIVDRKRLMYVMNIWLAAAAGGLAILGWLHLLSPYVLLGGVFLIGVGFAFNAPAWTAIQPEIVSNDELPSAATLGGLQRNISGIIGPAIGGLLLLWIGANSGENPPMVRNFLCVNRELHTRHHLVRRPSAMPEALSVDSAAPSLAA